MWSVIATWPFGLPAVKRAGEILSEGGGSLDAVEKGVAVAEDDPAVDSVGKGGFPNADGEVELDSAVMRGRDLASGAVAGLKRIARVTSVARHVLEDTNHALLVGEGALAFAKQKGFREEDLLTDAARAAWEKWRASTSTDLRPGSKAPPKKDHDTIGMVALDATGELSAACSTSGLAWKLPGRVGDSPIVGAGLYVDSSVGGASGTGIGEEIVRVLGSFLVVENMRRGMEPQEAIADALRRIEKLPPRVPGLRERQCAFVALRKDGAFAGLSLRKGFAFAVARKGETPRLIEAQHLF